jgi:hypothetical protein
MRRRERRRRTTVQRPATLKSGTLFGWSSRMKMRHLRCRNAEDVQDLKRRSETALRNELCKVPFIYAAGLRGVWACLQLEFVHDAFEKRRGS